MALKVHNLMPNTTLNHITSIKSTTIHPFGQVSLPKKNIRSAVRTTASSAAPVNDSCLFWREIQGSDNWDDLVDPLHPLLQQEIIRYGEFVSACYKAFDLDSSSKRYLHCKYGKNSLFEEVGMGDCDYQVTKYIYATPDVNSIPIPNGDHHSCGRWIGYVAVASDGTVVRLGRRDILVSFRGTVTNHEWMANLMSSLTPARLDPLNKRPDVKVESGFLSLYTSDENDMFGLGSCREQLLSEVSRLLENYKGEENVSITLASHSMGSSLALLLAYDIAELGLCHLHDPRPVSRQSNSHHICSMNNRHQQIPITVFSFGGPRVGNMAFKERFEELGVKVLRIVNVNDPITKLPGLFFNENFRVLGGKFEHPWSCSCYSHVRVEIAFDFFIVQKPSCVHDLETYISLIKNRRKVIHEDKDYCFEVENSVLDRARKLFLSSAHNINMMFPWVDVATNMVIMIV